MPHIQFFNRFKIQVKINQYMYHYLLVSFCNERTEKDLEQLQEHLLQLE